MLATAVLHAAARPGFWRKTVAEFARQANIAIKMEGIHEPNKPFELIKFANEDSLAACKVMCDSDGGGYSEASLTFVPGTSPQQPPADRPDISDAIEQSSEPSHALFKGNISTQLPRGRPDIQRSGYAAWRTRDRGYTLFGKLLWDVDPYTFLGLKFKSDGRKYFVNVQTESLVPTDLHQHLLPCVSPGQWETAFIPLKAFVRTNHGMVVEPQNEMMRRKVRSIGIGSTDRVRGPFELRIAEIYVTNKATVKILERNTGLDVDNYESEMDEQEAVRRREKKNEPEKILI